MQRTLSSLLNIFLLFFFFGCASTTGVLPKAPAMNETLLQQLWPPKNQELEYTLHGSLILQAMTIPVQGRLHRGPDNQVTIALMTSFGSSLLEARVSKNTAEIVAQSPILQRHQAVGDFLIHSIQQAYINPKNCFAEMAVNDHQYAQLRCYIDKNVDLYSFRQQVNGNYMLAQQFSATGIEITYSNLNTTPIFTAKQDRHGFLLQITHLQQ